VRDSAELAQAAAAAEPRWLSADERAAWLSLAGLLMKLPTALDAQLRRDAGLSHFDYMVLAMLSEAPGQVLRMSELAALANGSLSRLSHVIAKLEREGWVRRESCPGDGRRTNAILTDLGHAKIASAAPGHVQTVRSLVIDALTGAQLGQLQQIGSRILPRIDPDNDCTSLDGTSP
jgi:DNA-binding MarR family transcriptional regulator